MAKRGYNRIAVASACTVALLCCASGCAPAAQPKTVRRSLSVLLAPNQFPALSGALEKAFSASLPGLDIRFIQRDRGIDFVKAVRRGTRISHFFSPTALIWLRSASSMGRGTIGCAALPFSMLFRFTSWSASALRHPYRGGSAEPAGERRRRGKRHGPDSGIPCSMPWVSRSKNRTKVFPKPKPCSKMTSLTRRL